MEENVNSDYYWMVGSQITIVILFFFLQCWGLNPGPQAC